ncbi:hypothetical protein Ocin01_19503 [Orchesella cincta]|uniref:Uncharacterized protein n=1 Tax=Orchesella cincta TaxID=48709 RepID=A0A1D2M2H8_ORCCI|nr:hypothetical protein Ocin01_19503 [Orchesella cincta]
MLKGVEDPLKSSAVAYELLDLGEKYDIPRLEEVMKGLLLAKLDGVVGFGSCIEAVPPARLRSDELASETSTLLEDLWRKYPKAAKELWLASASQ